ncbi:MAG: hypothetical protein IPG46_20415 [Actinobacteria bacterium]|nr:hypothetical protein [Actinomycetota bacterium]
MSSFPVRVAAKAQTFSPVRALLAILVAPLWLLGALAGLAWLAATWAFAAAQVGFADVLERGRAAQRSELPPAADGDS